MSAIGGAVSWVEGVLLGSFAMTIGIISVASVGFLMLNGRIDVRRGVQVALGCFIIFGASTIADGILGAGSATGARADPVQLRSLPPPEPPLPAHSVPTSSTPFDPYAGAALSGK